MRTTFDSKIYRPPAKKKKKKKYGSTQQPNNFPPSHVILLTKKSLLNTSIAYWPDFTHMTHPIRLSQLSLARTREILCRCPYGTRPTHFLGDSSRPWSIKMRRPHGSLDSLGVKTQEKTDATVRENQEKRISSVF